jgi:long-chain acyl-CoA synthetase
MNSRTLYTVLEQTAAVYGSQASLHQPAGKDKYRTYTWNEYRDFAKELAVGLCELGVRKGDIVAIFSETRAEFYMADLGVMASGAISGALYTSYPMADQVRNLRIAHPRVIIVENEKSLNGLRSAFGNDPLETEWLLLMGEAEGVRTVADVRADGCRKMAEDPTVFERIRAEITPSDYAILYLTSGATGEPKMGLATHDSVVSNIDNAPAVLPVGPKDRTLVFLPSAHIAQRVVLEMVTLRMGVPVWFSESLAKLPNELRTVRPTFFLAPPRVWERVYASIWTEVRKKSGIAQRLFYAAVGVGAEAARLRQQGKGIPQWMKPTLKFFDRMVYSKIRARLGGRLRIAASGAAPLSKELGEFYAAIGMPLIEGYGLTEGGVVTLNPLERPKPGSIGIPMPNAEARLADDGELMIKSPSLFSGYFNDPAATAEVLKDGWLYTGDIAELDADGYLYITGRKKELIVSSNGKKIYPSRVESLFKSVPLINQVVLIGDRMPYVTALFTLNSQAVENISGGKELAGQDLAAITAAPTVQSEVRKAVAAVNKQLASFEQIRKFKILEREFTVESGELTPTMKVRRGRVLENYKPLISEMYMGKDVD